MARRQGHTFTAKCPAIMSQHYKDVLTKVKQRFADVTNIIIIDWSDLSDKTKVTQGRFALSAIKDSNQDINHSIINIFLVMIRGNCRSKSRNSSHLKIPKSKYIKLEYNNDLS